MMGQIGGLAYKYVSSNALLDIVQIELLCGGTWNGGGGHTSDKLSLTILIRCYMRVATLI